MCLCLLKVWTQVPAYTFKTMWHSHGHGQTGGKQEVCLAALE